MIRSHALKRLSLPIALGSALLLSGCSGFLQGDENLSEAVDLPKNPNSVSLQKDWQASVGDGTDEKTLKLQPFVTASRVFAVSADGVLSAFLRDSGKREWKRKIGQKIAAGVSGNGDLLIVGTENGLLMAFSATDGKQLWIYQLSSEVMAAPTVINDLVIARSIDGQVTALSINKGHVIWKQNIGIADLSIRGNARSLFLDGALLFTNAKGHMTLLSARDGSPILDAPITRGRGITAVQRIADLLATPAVRNGVLFLSSYRNETIAINLRDGSLLWQSNFATALDLFADNRFVYVVDKNSVIHALDQASGQEVWSSRVAEGRRISPLSGDGRHVVSVDNEGELLVLDADNGNLLGYKNVGDDRTYVAPMWIDGKWLTYTSNGKLTLTEME